MNIYYFTVLKKDNDFLAVIRNQNTQWELGHYYDQGYTFFMSVSAFNANSAIEIAKQNESSEIAKLQSEIASLRQQYQELLNENNQKFNRNFGHNVQSSNINPLEVLDFKEMPNKNELEKKYRSIPITLQDANIGALVM